MYIYTCIYIHVYMWGGGGRQVVVGALAEPQVRRPAHDVLRAKHMMCPLRVYTPTYCETIFKPDLPF